MDGAIHTETAWLGIEDGELHSSGDGFWALTASVAELLARRDIHSLPDEAGQRLSCRLYYDDWYLCFLESRIWGLFKLREQEHDGGDSDDPGVSISFVDFDAELLKRALAEPKRENLTALRRELYRVTALRGAGHHPAWKAYYLNPASRGSYLIGRLYIRKLAGFGAEGRLPLPENCRALLASSSGRRLRRFLEENNARAGREIFDGAALRLAPGGSPDPWEQLALLAVHTGNTSLHSFGAEVRFHAFFLSPLARIPFLGRSIYDSALRADMAIRPREWAVVCPYYRENSTWVRKQKQYNPDI